LSGSAITSCTYVINGVTKTTTSVQMLSTSPINIKLTDGFTTAAYTGINVPFTIACDGLKNPRSTAVTSSFQIYTTDTNGYAIESGTTGITTFMQTTPNMAAFSATPIGLVNG
jgi:hypothetical protein